MQIGAYAKGSSADSDTAIEYQRALNDLLRQGKSDATAFADAKKLLLALAKESKDFAARLLKSKGRVKLDGTGSDSDSKRCCGRGSPKSARLTRAVARGAGRVELEDPDPGSSARSRERARRCATILAPGARSNPRGPRMATPRSTPAPRPAGRAPPRGRAPPARCRAARTARGRHAARPSNLRERRLKNGPPRRRHAENAALDELVVMRAARTEIDR
ncbi:MAG: hypothetical protein IPI84_12495 [Holophagaceae bacterium]|nr:hypothetical protein [Holophagaceae bacterium]